jgi:carboxymethylenebutenolidase
MPRNEMLTVAGHPMRVAVSGERGRPGVIVMIHGPGLDAFIEAQVDDLAAHGYLTAAPDLFHRQPDDGGDTMARIARLRDREIIDDVAATVAHVQQLGAGPLAVLGFCMGGRNTYLLAGARPALWQAAGVFYGGNIMTAWGDGPSPVERTAQIACPVIGLFGRDDTNPSPDDVAAIDAELTRHGKPHEFHVYDGAGHAFLNFANPQRHRPQQAADAWAKLLAFLDRHLAAANRNG